MKRLPQSSPAEIDECRRAWLGPTALATAISFGMPKISKAEESTPAGAGAFGISVDDFGAKGDGTSDDAPAFQRAVDALGSAGGRILLGAKHYRLASAITISRAYVMFQGQGYAESPGPAGGTWLVINTADFRPFVITNYKGSETRGTSFRDLAVWQQQPAVSSAQWVPIDYPFVWTFDNMYGGASFDNIFLSNVTRGISCNLVGRLEIGYMKGQCYDTMVYIDQAEDVCHINYLESWFFTTSAPQVAAYMMEHYDPIRLGRVDGIYINNLFVFCARAGIHCVQTRFGNAKFVLGIFGCDHARYGVWFDHVDYQTNGTDISVIAQIGTNHVRWQNGGGVIPGGAQIMIENSHRIKLQITNTNAGFVDGSVIQVSGADNELTVSLASFSQFNLGTHPTPAPAMFCGNSTGGGPNTIEVSQPVKISHNNGGGVFGTDGNGQFVDPRARLASYMAEQRKG